MRTTQKSGTHRGRWLRAVATSAAAAVVATSAAVASPAPARAADTTTEAYTEAVLATSPTLYWKFDDLPGATSAKDSSGRNIPSRVANKTVTFGSDGKFGDAIALTKTRGAVTSTEQLNNPTAYTELVWFRTAGSKSKGRIMGFSSTTTASSGTSDRIVQMNTDGRLKFGANAKTADVLTSPGTYNDSKWHMAVASQGPGGMKLYVDGKLVAQNSVTGARNYKGYWGVGSDKPWSGAGGRYMMEGQLDEAAFYDRVLTDAEVSGLFDAAQPATAPSAAIQASITDLDLAVDGSDSRAASGRTISTYAWDFGDGSTGSGKTATHAYAEPGTYTVTLTVVDNKGATGTAATTVTATAPTPSPAPTAVIDVTTSELKALFDGGRSSSPNGSPIVSYQWDFGDGATSTDAQVNHLYQASGQYNVTLTVTNADGLSGTATKTVNVVAMTPYVYDTWWRSSTTKWGAANTGGTWTEGPGLSIEGAGVGTMTLTQPDQVVETFLPEVSARDTDSVFNLSFDKLPNGGSTVLHNIVRQTDGGDYRVEVVTDPDGTMALNLLRRTPGGVEMIGSTVMPNTYVPGQVLKVRFQVTGEGTTTLSAKAWLSSNGEPGTWQVTATDATPELQGAGAVGFAGAILGSPDGEQKIRLDNYRVVKP